MKILLKSIEMKMHSFRVQEQSVIVSLEGARKINSKTSEMVKEDMVDFIGRSGKQIVLDLRGISFAEGQGDAALKAIVELAKANERLFSLVDIPCGVLETVCPSGWDKPFVIGNN